MDLVALRFIVIMMAKRSARPDSREQAVMIVRIRLTKYRWGSRIQDSMKFVLRLDPPRALGPVKGEGGSPWNEYGSARIARRHINASRRPVSDSGELPPCEWPRGVSNS